MKRNDHRRGIGGARMASRFSPDVTGRPDLLAPQISQQVMTFVDRVENI